MSDISPKKNKEIKQIKVIQSLPVWLPQTQTWIYNQVKFLPEYIDSHIICGQAENLDQFLLPNINVIPEKSLLDRYGRSHFKSSGQRARLLWLLQNCLRLKPDVIHSHFGPTGWDDSFVVRLTKAKHIVTFYGFDVNMIPQLNPSWKDRYKSLFISADLFLCEGPHMARSIKALGCPQEKIRVHHLGVEVDRLPFKPRVWHPGQPLRILIAASFREKKGIPYALEAIGRLKNEVDIEVTIIGDATSEEKTRKEKKHILEIIDKYNLRPKVHMLGFQPYSVFLEHVYKNHIFLSPSITAEDGDTEGGAPVAIIEVIATGMPVVSSMHCDIPEVIVHGQTGLLAGEKNSEELACHLKWLVNHPENWSFLTKSGYEKIAKEFNVKIQASDLGEFYMSLKRTQ